MAQDFDVANSEYLTLASAVATAGPIVMACWHRADDTGGSAVMTIDQGGTNNYFRLGIGSNVVEARTRSVAQGSGAALSGAITADGATWEHFAGYYAQTSRYAYINSTPGSENTADITPAGLNRTEIGRNLGASTYADGELAEVAIYYNAGLTKAIADQIIASLAKGFSPLLVKPEWLVGYWPLIRDYDGRVGGDMGLGTAPDVADHCPIIYPSPSHIVYGAAAAVVISTTAIHILSTGVVEPNHASDSGNNLLLAGDIEVQGAGWFGDATDYVKLNSGIASEESSTGSRPLLRYSLMMN